MRSIEEIEKLILEEKIRQTQLEGLRNDSKTNIWKLWVYIMAYAHSVLEQIFDRYKTELIEQLHQLKPHTAKWYRQKALDYQQGFALKPDSDEFNNLTKNDKGEMVEDKDKIKASKIIKYAAVVERDQHLVIKIAGEIDKELKPIDEKQKEGFETYINRIKDAGVPIRVINYPPDRLQLKLKIYRDPLVLDENGVPVIGGDKPVEKAIKEHIRNLPFDGELVLASLIDRLQAIEGVKIPHLIAANTAWIKPGQANYALSQIEAYKVPESGYFCVSFSDDANNKEYQSEITYHVQG